MRFSKAQMKTMGLMLVVLMAATCGLAAAKENKLDDKKATAQAAEAEQQKLVKVSTLGSVEANQEFQRNVQIMQAERQRVIQLQTQLEQTQTKELKKGLEKELKAALKKLNDDNKKMVETYGFSLNRNYVLVVEKAHVYMAVSDEEAAQIEDEQKKAEK